MRAKPYAFCLLTLTCVLTAMACRQAGEDAPDQGAAPDDALSPGIDVSRDFGVTPDAFDGEVDASRGRPDVSMADRDAVLRDPNAPCVELDPIRPMGGIPGHIDTVRLAVRSCGGGQLEITSISLDGPVEFALDALTRPEFPVLLPGAEPNGAKPERAFAVSFTAISSGVIESTLVIESNDPTAPRLETRLVGEARTDVCPQARAEPGRGADVGEVVVLDGSAAFDVTSPGRRPVQYEWVTTTRPETSLSFVFESIEPGEQYGVPDDLATPTAVFAPDTPGTYHLALRVSDAIGRSSEACGGSALFVLVVREPGAPVGCAGAGDCAGLCRGGECIPAECGPGQRRTCAGSCGRGKQGCVEGTWGACEVEGELEFCSDGWDGDCDGADDPPDVSCHGADACRNFIDDDADGYTDYPVEPGCAQPADADESDSPRAPACNNQVDDDGDGRADAADPGCDGPIDADESGEEYLLACHNGVDDDGDGRVDFPQDPGCPFAGGDDETDPPAPRDCSNGLDDDGDGHVDFPEDPGCPGRGTRSETDPAWRPACSDGRDNDGDGRIDYGDDDGCASAAESSEE
ncbi:hypothetical protein L6V77_23910 [Myxococcota bacterium]|nr:hypothetical protein [Myxococcota bacterium]